MSIHEREHVSINGVTYPIKGRVEPQDISRFPGKIVIGDATRSDQENVSEITISDLTGGLGVEKMVAANTPDRFFDSDGAWTMDPLGTHLGPLATVVLSAITEKPEKIFIFNNLVYVLGQTVLYYESTGTLAAENPHSPGAAQSLIDAVIFENSSYTSYMYICDKSYSGTRFITSTPPGAYTSTNDPGRVIEFSGKFLFANDRGIYELGGSTAIISWWNKGWPTSFFTFRNPETREETIGVGFADGFYYVDYYTGQMYRVVDLSGQTYADNCKNTLVHRDELFIPTQWQLLRMSGGTITDMGLNKDDGLVSGEDPRIRGLAGCNEYIIAAAGRKLYAWNGRGWHTLFTAGSGYNVYAPTLRGDMTEGDTSVKVYFVFSESNGAGGTQYQLAYVELPVSGCKPSKDATFKYQSTNTVLSQYYDLKFTNWDKVAVSVGLTCKNMTANETIAISYRTDNNAGWTSLGTVTANGVTDFLFASGAGITFKKIQFKVVYARGGTNTLSPFLESVTFRCYLAPDLLQAWRVTLDCTHECNGLQPSELLTALQTAKETKPEIVFNYFPGTDYYVKILNGAGWEETGQNRTGQHTIVLAELG